jgi:hypothetical protein
VFFLPRDPEHYPEKIPLFLLSALLFGRVACSDGESAAKKLKFGAHKTFTEPFGSMAAVAGGAQVFRG